MNSIKRYLGIVWMLIGPAALIGLVLSAYENINSAEKGDISNPVPWIIIIIIFIPIAIGLSIFGWYCLKGEYDKKVI
jgi:Ni/Fe-hydrogenase subunit HybB-like protein